MPKRGEPEIHRKAPLSCNTAFSMFHFRFRLWHVAGVGFGGVVFMTYWLFLSSLWRGLLGRPDEENSRENTQISRSVIPCASHRGARSGKSLKVLWGVLPRLHQSAQGDWGCSRECSQECSKWGVDRKSALESTPWSTLNLPEHSRSTALSTPDFLEHPRSTSQSTSKDFPSQHPCDWCMGLQS